MSEKIEIFDISYDGAGVGKAEGKICFVPKTLPGEVVQARIVSENGKFCLGECKNILKESQMRVPAICPYFDICGGCDFQHCNYEKEQEIKQQILARELRKIGFSGYIGFEPCKNRFFYRNKIKFEVKNGKLGYFRPKSHEFFEVETCPICQKNILKALPYIDEFLQENKLKGLKSVYLRDYVGDIVVCFLFDKNSNLEEKNLKKTAIFDQFLIYFAFGDVLESDGTRLVKISEPLIESEIKGGASKKIKDAKNADKEINAKKTQQNGSFLHNFHDFDVRAFSQINDEIAAKLYSEILETVAGKRVVNAYSGQGLLTLKIADKADFVFGIEMQRSAHEKAEQICAKKGNIKNICGRVEKELQKINQKVDLIVLDPARAGCQKVVLQEIVKRKIQEIAYISCNFATLVRDLAALKEFYEIEEVKIFDMFPCTANMETFVKLKCKQRK